jgi:Kef-type K+ transport system membrane component KefB
MELIISILILLASSIIVGAIFERFGLPEVVGQILSGVIIGPAVFGIVQPSDSLSAISEMALFFIVLLLGLEVTSKTLTSHSSKSLALSVNSFIIPAIAMFVISYLFFGIPLAPAIIVSIGIAVPSISIVSVLLTHYSLLGTEDGDKLLSSVVISDMLAFITLAAVYDSFNPYLILLLVMIITVFIISILLTAGLLRRHYRGVNRFFADLNKKKNGETTIFAIIIILGLIISSFLQVIGITFVLGAFFSGMLIEEFIVGKAVFRTLVRTFRRINTSFFIPLFFSIAGLAIQLPGFDYIIILVALVLTSALFSSLFINSLSKRSFKSLKPESAMSILGGRGAVGVVIATVALSEGLINIPIYSIIIFGTIILSLTFPVFVKPKFKTKHNEPQRRMRTNSAT